MSYSETVKNELARVAPDNPCCKLSELAGLVRAAGTIRIAAGGQVSLVVRVGQAPVARRAFLLMKEVAAGPVRMSVFRGLRLQRHNTFQVESPLDAVEERAGETPGGALAVGAGTDGAHGRHALETLGLMDGRGQFSDVLPPGMAKHACCRRAYLRGLFLGSGWVTDPGHEYHLEFVVATERLARAVAGLISRSVPGARSRGEPGAGSGTGGRAGAGAGVGMRQRGGTFSVYLKDADLINNFLKALGASAGSLAMEQVRVLKDVRNDVNRRVNAETANLDKTVRASVEQINDIKLIQKTVGLQHLPLPLQEVARLRLAFPQASLTEIGSRLKPRASKSAVNHRIRRLRQLARALERGETDGQLPTGG